MKIRCAPVRNKGARAVDTRQLAIDRAEIIPRDNRRRAFNREPPSCDLRDGDLSALKFRTKIRRLNFYFASLPPENGQIIKPITERGVARARARCGIIRRLCFQSGRSTTEMVSDSLSKGYRERRERRKGKKELLARKRADDHLEIKSLRISTVN